MIKLCTITVIHNKIRPILFSYNFYKYIFYLKFEDEEFHFKLRPTRRIEYLIKLNGSPGDQDI